MNIEQDLREIIENAVHKQLKEQYKHNMQIPAGISNRHIHLSRKHVELLFGENYCLTKLKNLSQTGQYAAKETLTIQGPRGKIQGVRILGPEREQSQVELMLSDTYTLGIKAPVRESGDLENTPGITLEGPRGVIKLNSGVISAQRHIHLNPLDAELAGLKDRDVVMVRTNGERALTFSNVVIRIHPSFITEFHIDMDEANSAGIVKGDYVEVLK